MSSASLKVALRYNNLNSAADLVERGEKSALRLPMVGPKVWAEAKKLVKRATIGRPAEMDGGKRVNVYLDKTSLQRAAEIGDGNVSAGIRKSLSDSAALKNRSKS